MRKVNFEEASGVIREAARLTAIETNNGNLTCHEIWIPDQCNLVVFGDLHGEFEDFREKFARIDVAPETTHYVFMGDLIDGRDNKTRNEFDLLSMIAKLKIDRPQMIHMLLGNHELMGMLGTNPHDCFLNTYLWSDYEGSDASKLEYVRALLEWYLVSPIVVVVSRKKHRIALVHGGPGFANLVETGGMVEFQMPEDRVYDLSSLNKVAKRLVLEPKMRRAVGPGELKLRVEQHPAKDALIPGTSYDFFQALEELLWSDVSEEGAVHPNFGRGKRLRKQYGPIASAKFLAVNSLDFLARGHQPRKTDFLDTETTHVVSTNFRIHSAHNNRVITVHHSKRKDLKPLYTCILAWRSGGEQEIIKIERDDEMSQLIGVEFGTWKLAVQPSVFPVTRYLATGGKIGKVRDAGFPEKPNYRTILENVVEMCEPGDVLLFAGGQSEKFTGIINYFQGRITHAAIVVIDETISRNRENPLKADSDGRNVIVLESNRYPPNSIVMKYDHFHSKMSEAELKEMQEYAIGLRKEKEARIERLRISRELVEKQEEELRKEASGRTEDVWENEEEWRRAIGDTPKPPEALQRALKADVKPRRKKIDDTAAKKDALEIMGTPNFRLPSEREEKTSGVRSTSLREFLRFYVGEIYLCKLPRAAVDGIPGGRQTLNYRLLQQFKKMYHLQFEEDLMSFVNAYFDRPFRNWSVPQKTVYCSEFVAEILQRVGVELSKGWRSELYTPSDFDNTPTGKEGDFVISQEPLLVRTSENWVALGLPESLMVEIDYKPPAPVSRDEPEELQPLARECAKEKKN